MVVGRRAIVFGGCCEGSEGPGSVSPCIFVPAGTRREDGGCGRIVLERRRDIVMDRSDPREAVAWTILFVPC